jgi:hypothetical protein
MIHMHSDNKTASQSQARRSQYSLSVQKLCNSMWRTASFLYVVDATDHALWRWQLRQIISFFGEEPGHGLTNMPSM